MFDTAHLPYALRVDLRNGDHLAAFAVNDALVAPHSMGLQTKIPPVYGRSCNSGMPVPEHGIHAMREYDAAAYMGNARGYLRRVGDDDVKIIALDQDAKLPFHCP